MPQNLLAGTQAPARGESSGRNTSERGIFDAKPDQLTPLFPVPGRPQTSKKLWPSANPALKFTGNGFTRTPTRQFDCGVGAPADEIGAAGLRQGTGRSPDYW